MRVLGIGEPDIENRGVVVGIDVKRTALNYRQSTPKNTPNACLGTLCGYNL